MFKKPLKFNNLKCKNNAAKGKVHCFAMMNEQLYHYTKPHCEIK